MNDIDKEIQEDVKPLLDMFGGADGGGGFAKFRHSFLPDVYKLNTPEAIEFKRWMKRFAALAELMNKQA
jgi:hypothetical protein